MRSLSNLIKAYSVRYTEERKLVDVSKREEELVQKRELLTTEPEDVFVSGLQAIALKEQTGEVSETEDTFLAATEEDTEAPREKDDLGASSSEESKEERLLKSEQRRKELNRVKYELTQAEKLALKIEMENEMRTRADVMLEQARAEGEHLKMKIKLQAEAERLDVLNAAKEEGYAAGREALHAEKAELEATYRQREQSLITQYEQKERELEPKVTEVLIELLTGITGVLLTEKKQIMSYLVSKAIQGSERGNSFLIKVSGEDYDEVRATLPKLRELFEREVTIEAVQDALLSKGECLIETEYGIIDCSLSTQLSGLIEDIRLLSVQEG